MTIKELEKLQYLDSLISTTTRRILELEEKLDVGAQVITDMPKNPGAVDSIGDTIPDIVDRKAKLVRLKARYETEKAKIEAYIDEVEDYHVRLILTLRFVSFMTWAEVAGAIGGNNTEDGVKKTCYRFFE